MTRYSNSITWWTLMFPFNLEASFNSTVSSTHHPPAIPCDDLDNPSTPNRPFITLASSPVFHLSCQSRHISHGWLEVCGQGSKEGGELVEVKVEPRWS